MGIEKEFLKMGLQMLMQSIMQGEQAPVGEQLPDSNLSGKDAALADVKRKEGSIAVMLGTRDTGKTELSRRYAQFLGRPTYAVSPEQRTPSWITRVAATADITVDSGMTIDDVPPMSTLIFDDLPAYASNRDYNDALVRSMERLMPMVRHERKLHLVFCSQSAAQADKYILDCDIAFFKPLGLLADDLERPNVKKVYKEFVNPHFDSKPHEWVIKHTYMMHREWRGLITVSKSDGEGVPIEGQVREVV